jgi:hypothetical protein
MGVEGARAWYLLSQQEPDRCGGCEHPHDDVSFGPDNYDHFMALVAASTSRYQVYLVRVALCGCCPECDRRNCEFNSNQFCLNKSPIGMAGVSKSTCPYQQFVLPHGSSYGVVASGIYGYNVGTRQLVHLHLQARPQQQRQSPFHRPPNGDAGFCPHYDGTVLRGSGSRLVSEQGTLMSVDGIVPVFCEAESAYATRCQATAATPETACRGVLLRRDHAHRPVRYGRKPLSIRTRISSSVECVGLALIRLPSETLVAIPFGNRVWTANERAPGAPTVCSRRRGLLATTIP